MNIGRYQSMLRQFNWGGVESYRVAKAHRMPYRHRSFSAKEPYYSGSFAERNLRLKTSYGSLPPCICYHIYTYIPTCMYINICICKRIHICVYIHGSRLNLLIVVEAWGLSLGLFSAEEPYD